jgi:hypothetical protein
MERKRVRRTQFWGAHPDDDSLVLEVLAGLKTATVCTADEVDLPAGEFAPTSKEPT